MLLRTSYILCSRNFNKMCSHYFSLDLKKPNFIKIYNNSMLPKLLIVENISVKTKSIMHQKLIIFVLLLDPLE